MSGASIVTSAPITDEGPNDISRRAMILLDCEDAKKGWQTSTSHEDLEYLEFAAGGGGASIEK